MLFEQVFVIKLAFETYFISHLRLRAAFTFAIVHDRDFGLIPLARLVKSRKEANHLLVGVESKEKKNRNELRRIGDDVWMQCDCVERRNGNISCDSLHFKENAL